MEDRKTEIIRLQSEIIQQLTQRNLRSTVNDFWSPVKKESSEGQKSPRDNVKREGSGIGETKTEKPAKEEPKETIEDIKKELNEAIGLKEVKSQIDSLINWINITRLRGEHNLPKPDLSLHMVFSGNPGTGKTMIARLMARVYKTLGILSKGHLVEVDRSMLVAGYVGQTAIKTKEVIEKAMGGVLFIDEAYSLTSRGMNDFGAEAVDTLIKEMEDRRDDLIVIAAGYINPMKVFVHSNPGLESRFNRFWDFPDYTADEMMAIFDMRCGKSGYIIDDTARAALREIIARESGRDPVGFGNARGVRNLFELAIAEQADRLAKLPSVTREQLMQILAQDIPGSAKGAPSSPKAADDPASPVPPAAPSGPAFETV